MKSFRFLRKFDRAAKKAAVFGSLAAYFFALVILPALHGHGDCCDKSEQHACCDHHETDSMALVFAVDDCDLCRFLHTTVPFAAVSIAVIETPCRVPQPLPLLSVFYRPEILEIPSCRAPPLCELA